MIRIIETPFTKIDLIFDDEGVSTEVETLLYTIVETFEDTEIVIEEDIENNIEASSHIESTLVETKRIMPNGDYYIINGNIEQYVRKIQESEIDELKSDKFKAILSSSEQALKSFQFNNLTFESSGESKSNLIFVQSQMAINPSLSTPWLALNGTYKLGQPNLIMLDSTNISDFANAMKLKNEQVFAWQMTQLYYLEQATTIEEVLAISTDYPQ